MDDVARIQALETELAQTNALLDLAIRTLGTAYDELLDARVTIVKTKLATEMRSLHMV